MSRLVAYNRDIASVDLGGGVSRKVLSYSGDMMVVEVRFETGGVGAVHAHPHVQCCYVASGVFCFNIDGTDVTVRAGDSITFESGVPHGTRCLEEGTLVDVFTPMRADFL